jgi:aryl-alcohol dehydrogenase-like predicted oxidoreductase
VAQVQENLGALEVIERLTDDVLERIDQIMTGSSGPTGTSA